ncbi:MAG: PilN domain-containing protein [Acidobacteriota bacterium]
MRISVNLATRPFVELRPFFLRLRIIMASLLVAAIAIAIFTHFQQKKLDRATEQMNKLQARTQAAEMEKAQNERRMRQPENAGVLERARFLNRLFLRKSFSWTAVMMDLETVLPSGVQVTSIEPQISVTGEVNIRLRVTGQRDRAIQLVRNLERSRRFLAPRLTAEVTAAKEQNARGQMIDNGGPAPGVEFEIMAAYNPLPENEAYPKTKAVAAAAASEAPEPAPATIPRRFTQPRPQQPPQQQQQAMPPNGRYPRDGVVLRPYNPPPVPPHRPGQGGVR